MGVTGGGPGALVTQQCLHDPQRHAPFPQRAGLGVPQRMDGGSLGHAALAHHRFAGLLPGVGGPRCRPVPGGEHPGAGPLALPVLPSQRQPPGGQWPAAVLAPVAATYVHQHPLRVNV